VARVAISSNSKCVNRRPKRAGEVGRNFASFDLANKMLGYSPAVSREVGIPRTWKWLQETVFQG
jgi:hypothetical protein